MHAPTCVDGSLDRIEDRKAMAMKYSSQQITLSVLFNTFDGLEEKPSGGKLLLLDEEISISVSIERVRLVSTLHALAQLKGIPVAVSLFSIG